MLGYTAVTAAVLISAWWSERSFSAVEQAAERLSRRSVEGMELTAELGRLVKEKSDFEDALLRGSPQALPAAEAANGTFLTWLEQMREFARGADEQDLLETMRRSYNSFSEHAAGIEALASRGDGVAAHAMLDRLADDVASLLANSQRLFRRTEEDMRTRQQRAEAAVARVQQLVLWTTVLGGLSSLVLGFVLSRHATRPIYRLALRLGSSGGIDRVEFDGDEIGTIEAHVGSLLDRVRRQERALQQAEKLSELGEIASELAHEILNPVAGMKAMLQALRRSAMPREQIDVELVNLEHQLSRVDGIVRRLMRYARPLEPRMQATSVARLVERARQAAAIVPAARDRPIVVAGPVPSDEWVMDPDLIEQVLLNLLVNACEASPPAAPVEIAAWVEAQTLHLAVRDRGTGLHAIDRDRLFHPFFTTKPRGNGLGLAISRNIVREHGGQIDALARASGGSEFHLLLPSGELACAEPS